MKYVVMSLPEPTEKNRQDKITEKLEEYRAKGMDDFSRNIYRMRMERAERQTQDQPALIGRQHGRIPIRR
jgi:hypothetical protein